MDTTISSDKLSELYKDLQVIQDILHTESMLWYSSNRSATAEKLSNYITSIELLKLLLLDNDILGFNHAIRTRNISIKDIGLCFRKGTTSQQRKDNVIRLLNRICDELVSNTT